MKTQNKSSLREKLFSQQFHVSESLVLGILLAIVGGYLDTYSYLSRGQVFANAQTGNIVLLGLNLSKGQYANSLHYLFPILAFAAGIVLSEMIRTPNYESFHWRQVVIAIELCVLTAVAFMPEETMDYMANIGISFVCSLQVQAFRKLHGAAFATTMCTGNLRSGTECLCAYFKTKNPLLLHKAKLYFLIIAFFIFGAAMGALLTTAMGIHAVLACVALLVLVFILMFE